MIMFRKKSKPAKPDYEAMGRMIEGIFESGYADKNKTYKMSFIKGVMGGFGGVVGATLVVAVLLWSLSLLSDIPLVESLRSTLQGN